MGSTGVALRNKKRHTPTHIGVDVGYGVFVGIFKHVHHDASHFFIHIVSINREKIDSFCRCEIM